MITDILLILVAAYLVIGIIIASIADALADEDAGAFTVFFWPVYLLKLLGAL
jgi:hypothetical protein